MISEDAMKEYDIRALKRVRLMGRYDRFEPGFRMVHSGACAEMRVKGSRLDMEIEAAHDDRRHYISFVVDGLIAQTFAPIPGRHVYTVFLDMNPQKTHDVLIIKETMDYEGMSFVTLHRLFTDGSFMPLRKREMRIEFIGDSVTAGEGLRGPKKFCEWIPMVYGALEGLSYVTAQKLHACYNTVAISGWGLHNGWNNDRAHSIPAIYDRIGLSVNKPYPFDFDPDAIVIELGENDKCSMSQPPFTDENNISFRMTDDETGRKLVYDSALNFICHLHRVNPRARMLWIMLSTSGMVHDMVSRAVETAASEGIDIRFDEPVDLNHMPRGGMGSRRHPGPLTHKIIAGRIAKLLKQ